MRHPWLDCSQAPILITRLPAEASDDELSEMFAAVDRYHKLHPGAFVRILDLSRLERFPASQRKLVADRLRMMAEFDARYCKGMAIWAPDSVKRGIVTAIHWMQKPAYKFVVSDTFAHAVVWARHQLVACRSQISSVA